MFFFRKKKHNAPEKIKNYLSFKNNTLHRKTPIQDITFVIFDTETTGFRKGHDQLISIGALKVQDFTIHIQGSLEIIFPYIPDGSMDHVTIHQITPVEAEKGISIEKGLLQFLDYAGNAVLVGHHVDFDISMINYYLKKHFHIKLYNRIVDTAKLAQRVDANKNKELINSSDYQLDKLCNKYNVDIYDRHTAPGDALATALLLIKLLRIAADRKIMTLGDLIYGGRLL